MRGWMTGGYDPQQWSPVTKTGKTARLKSTS